ncbi:hypothetical protein TNCV_4061351 [Trichonephila clavipes]|nr:hypothetical protein TNCV_4061351 [Trichonephila clavipes]
MELPEPQEVGLLPVGSRETLPSRTGFRDTTYVNSLLSRVYWRFSFQKPSKNPAALSFSQTQDPRCKPSKRASAKSATKPSNPSTKSSQKEILHATMDTSQHKYPW